MAASKCISGSIQVKLDSRNMIARKCGEAIQT